MVICLERGADLHMAQVMPLPFTVSCFSKIQIVFLPFWYRLTWVVLDKGPLNGCACVALVFGSMCVEIVELLNIRFSDFIAGGDFCGSL